jgi:phosphatidylserine decarboxylase
MDGTDSRTNDYDQLVAAVIENPSEFLPTIDDDDEEEICQAQTAFSEMIGRTCLSDSISQEDLHKTQTPEDCFGFLFRSIIPTQETIKQDFESELPANLFKYQNGEGGRYAFKVLDRRANRLTYEQMPSYHRYGMRLLFRGPVQRELLHTSAIINFFARETLRLGEAFDEPKSRKHIPTFVKMYQIDLNELLEPNISMYFTFNEFFYRKLKSDARPIDNRDDPTGIVSAADCRLILFDNISEATRVWIKGQQFSLRHLFEDEKLAQEFDGGSIAVFRLAPADYHRFHSPVKGTIGKHMKKITGTYYTVNPIGIKEKLDVLTRNQRTVITIKSECFERVAFVAIGALLVGSVNFTVEPYQSVEKGDELGKMKDNFYILYLVR